MKKNNTLKNVSETLRYSIEQFDKYTLFIASGALGISFAFIKDIIHNFEQATSKQFLVCSWYIFAGVIFTALLNHFLSMLANTWAIRNDDLDTDTFNKKIVRWNWPIRILNVMMIVAILIGAFMMIYFIDDNI